MVTSSPEGTPIVTQEGAHRALSAVAIIQSGLPYDGKIGAHALVDQVGGRLVWNDLIAGSETYIGDTVKPELSDRDEIYSRGVHVGFFATLAASRTDEGINEASIAHTLTTVSELDLTPTKDRPTLTEMLGGKNIYDYLTYEVQEFTERFPGLYEHMSPSTYLSGIWLGMFAGAAAVHNPTGEHSHL